MSSLVLIYLFLPRQLALKALNERLSKVSDQGGTWPSLDEVEATPPTTPESLSSAAEQEKVPSVESMVHQGATGGGKQVAGGEKATGSHSRSSSASMPKLPVPDFKENAKLSDNGDQAS